MSIRKVFAALMLPRPAVLVDSLAAPRSSGGERIAASDGPLKETDRITYHMRTPSDASLHAPVQVGDIPISKDIGTAASAQGGVVQWHPGETRATMINKTCGTNRIADGSPSAVHGVMADMRMGP